MRVLWIAAVVIVVDQVTKLAVVRLMYMGQSIPVLGDGLRLTYTENPGMAFGITFGPRGMVTAFSIIATALIIAYLVSVRRGYAPYRVGLALILGGALGNIIDRVFYGVLFGYDTLFVGRVVDFIHVNLWRGYVSEAVPFIGGTYVQLFPIWNVADMAIVAGVVAILTFQNRFHQQQLDAHDRTSEVAGDGSSGGADVRPASDVYPVDAGAAATDVQPAPSDVRDPSDGSETDVRPTSDVHPAATDVQPTPVDVPGTDVRSTSDVRPDAPAPPPDAEPEPISSASEPGDGRRPGRTSGES